MVRRDRLQVAGSKRGHTGMVVASWLQRLRWLPVLVVVLMFSGTVASYHYSGGAAFDHPFVGQIFGDSLGEAFGG